MNQVKLVEGTWGHGALRRRRLGKTVVSRESIIKRWTGVKP